ncbi:MAG: hypothetical protein EXR05_00040 [Acetobacteraceae bacterium]|nr:hypothetical protein [Acetobacteraceae bacterium]
MLDSLPRSEVFDWVEQNSISLTTMLLNTLSDYPFAERADPTHWSDIAICNVNDPDAPVHSKQPRFDKLKKMAEAMARRCGTCRCTNS